MKTCFSRVKSVAFAAVFLSTAISASAQINFPAASPHGVIDQKVGLTDVTIDYSRPSAKGREIFGGLVPMGEVWRTGANSPSKITFSEDVVLGGAKVPAGSYALFSIPGKSEWTMIVYSATEGWGSVGYDKSKDLARFTVKPTKLSHMVETLTIGIDDLKNDSAVVYLDWEHTRVSFLLEVDTAGQVMSQINALKDSPEFQNSNTLFGAASYYHDSGLDLKQALAWITTAVETREEPAFWMYARKARIEVDLKKKKAARASAEKTRDLAKAANNMDYVKIANDILAAL